MYRSWYGGVRVAQAVSIAERPRFDPWQRTSKSNSTTEFTCRLYAEEIRDVLKSKFTDKCKYMIENEGCQYCPIGAQADCSFKKIITRGSL